MTNVNEKNVNQLALAFKIRSASQRMLSARAAAAADLKSTVKMLAEITRNIPETIESGDAAPMLYLLDYLAGEKGKAKAATAIIRAVTFGVSVKMNPETGRFSWNVKDKAGVNSRFEILERFVAGGNAGLMNNTLHDELAIRKEESENKFDVNKRAKALVDAAVKAGVSIEDLRKAFDEATQAALTAENTDPKTVFGGNKVKLIRAA